MLPKGNEQARQALHNDIDSTTDALNTVWDKIGLDESAKKSRLDTAVLHIKNLLKEMLGEEQSMMAKIAQNIQSNRVKLDKLSEELSIDYIKLPDNLTMMKEEHMLRTQLESLQTEKSARMDKYEELHDKDDKLCENLAEIPYYVPSGTVPSLQQLKELEAHVNRLTIEKEKRTFEFNEFKSKVCHLYNTMEIDPESSFAHDVVCEDTDTFTLSLSKLKDLKMLHDELVLKDERMKLEVEDSWDRLRALWNRLETPEIEREAFSLDRTGHGQKVINSLKSEIALCEELKLQNIQKFIEGIRTELVSWWDRCFFDPQQRKSFTLYYEDNFTEALLEAHEKELEKVRDYYKEHRDILDKVTRREELFKSMVVFESKASDPKRFFNDRGGKLLVEEKQRKKILKDLPKMEEEVSEFISHWEKANQKQFFVSGVRFPQYVIRQWEDFHRHKEQEKQDRMKARAKQTQEEIMFGSKSALITPGKRKNGAPTTPMRTPLKARKQLQQPTPMTARPTPMRQQQPGFSVKVKVECGRRLNGPVKTPNTTGRLPPVSRIQHSTVFHSPLCTPKTPLTTVSSKKRRSIRLMQKAATERRSSNSKRRRSRDIFSHTTVSSDNNTTSSLASTCSYNEFARHMSHSKTSSPETFNGSSSSSSEDGLSRPNCRSSVAPSNPMLSGLRR